MKSLPLPVRLVCAAVWLLSTLCVPSFAQYRASLQGTITDPSGATVPGATVTLKSEETNVAHTVTTNSSGVYAISALAPGRYDLTVEATGFNKKALNGVTITSEQAQSQDVQLELAQQATTTVTVSAAAAPVLDTETANISGTLTGEQIKNLPTFGGDPFQAVELAPGTFGDNSRSSSGSGSNNLPGNAGPGGTSGSTSVFQTENQVQAVADGQRTENNSFQIDGVEVNSLAWGGAAVITPNEESIKEVTVQSNPYDAENGRNSGAQVLAVTKNGTNEFHGSAMIKWDRPEFNAYQRWNGPNNPVQKDTDRYNEYAGSLGGPIIHNHLFFFFSYETLLNHSLSTGQEWFETPQFISTVTSAAPNSIAAKILGYPGEGASYSAIIPKSCADAGLTIPGTCQPAFVNGQYAGLDIGSPLKTGLGKSDPTYMSPGQPGIGSGLDGIPDIMFVETANPFEQRPQQYNGRMDFQVTQRDLVTFTEFFVPVTTTDYNGPVRAANLWHNDRLNEDGTLLWNHTITPSWLNEVRFSVTRWHWNEVASNPQEPFGLPQNTVDNFGSVSPLQPVGPPGPSIFNQTTYNIRDTSSTVIKAHSIKFGTDIYREQDNDNEAYAARPQYFFNNIWDLANDAPYKEVGNFDPTTGQPTSATKYIRSAIWAFFVQDDWKVKPNLTLNLGLRWEYFEPVHEKYGNISNAILGNDPLDPLTGVTLKVGGNLYHPDYGNFGPQFGFAWTPGSSQKFVIRGGAGIGYNRMEEAITLNGRANPPLVENLTLLGSNVLYMVPGNVHQFSGWPINPAAIATFSPSTGLPTGAPVTLDAFPENLVTPRSYRYSLDTDYDLGHNWVAKIGYQGSLSRHLTVQNNLNFIYAPLNPQIQNLYWYYNGANSSYNALLTEIEHKFSNQFQIDAQYRWSHTIDEGSNSYFIGNYPYSLAAEKSNADFDVRHNFKLYGLYTPHIFKSHSWADRILGGWQISGIWNWHSGFPWTPTYANYGCNIVYFGSGYCTLQPAGYLGGAGSDYSNATFMSGPNSNFSKGSLAYFVVPTYTPATATTTYAGFPPAPSVGRNSLRGPNYFDIDMNLQKSWGLPKLPMFGENARITTRADFFNIFNKLNLFLNPGDPTVTAISFDGVTSNPHFGQAQQALGARVIEFQARLEF
jgi:hypothetical protein